MPIIPINSSVTTLSPESLSPEELLEYIESKRDESIQQSINARADILAVCEDEDASLQDAYMLYNDRTGSNMYVSARVEQSQDKALGLQLAAGDNQLFQLEVQGYTQAELSQIFAGKVTFNTREAGGRTIREMTYRNITFDVRRSSSGGFAFSLLPGQPSVNDDRLDSVLSFYTEFQAGNPDIDLLSELRRATANTVRQQTEIFQQLEFTANLANDPQIRQAIREDTLNAIELSNESSQRETIIDNLIRSASNLPKGLVYYFRDNLRKMDPDKIRALYLSNRDSFVFSRAGDVEGVEPIKTGESRAIAAGVPIKLHGVVDTHNERPFDNAKGMYGGKGLGRRVYYQYKPIVPLQCRFYPLDVDHTDNFEINGAQDELFFSFIDAKLMRSMMLSVDTNLPISEGRSVGAIPVAPSDIDVAYVPDTMRGKFPLEGTETPIRYY